MSVAFISHPDCLLHDMGYSHPEQPARLTAIESELIRSGLDTQLNKYQASLATAEQLLRVHSADYIDYINQIAPQAGLISLDADTWMNQYTLTAALYAAGACIQAVDLVMSGEVQSAFCNIRPPGHHAEKERAMGFCIFNNIAVAVAHALTIYKLNRVAIVDFDVHHGNGTEDIFQNEPRVLFCSSFQHPFYPFSGAETHNNHIINIPLAAGTTGEIFRERTQTLWFEAIHQFAPEMIFFSAGFDAYKEDEMAQLLLNEDDYYWITEQVRMIAEKCCQGRIVSTLEGGYELAGLGRCACAHIRALL